MRLWGLCLLVLGVALCAAFGSQLTPSTKRGLTLAGSASLHTQAEARAFKAYCLAWGSWAQPGPRDDCPEPPAQAQAPSTAPSELRLARQLWLAKKAVAQVARAHLEAHQLPTPRARLRAWFQGSGLPFSIGLVLLVSGALISRRAILGSAREPQQPAAPGLGAGSGAGGFEVQLSALQQALAQLATEMAARTTPTQADMLGFQASLEALQLEHVEGLINTKAELNACYGVRTFAEIFGPLSGAERRLHRAWSALVDKHLPEARASVERATQELARAREAWLKASVARG